uniref:C2H2-type domain-containing protein n=2 Tax=Parastrongyloides trichosuri TaxID=131310 RepID=A0A0N4ZLG1_PARTI
MHAKCPECLFQNVPDEKNRIHIANFERHFAEYHHAEYRRLKKKYLCIEDSCVEAREDRLRKSFLTEYYPSSYKKHLIKKHFINFSSSVVDESIEELDQEEIEPMEIDNVESSDVPQEDQPVIDDIWEFDEELDIVEPSSTEKKEEIPQTIQEWEKYYKKVILDFFDTCPGSEQYLRQLKTLISKAIMPFKTLESANAKSGLMKLSCDNIIKEGKNIVRNFDVSSSDEIILPNDDIDGNPVKRDKFLYYYLPLHQTVPVLMKKMNMPVVDKVKIVLYADDIQANNVLGSHRATGSFLHVAFKLFLPGNEEVAKATSKITNIQTMGVILSEATKQIKYDSLLAKILRDIEELKVFYKGREVSFELFALSGDHAFLQDVYHLPKSYNGSGGSCCRTCLTEGRLFHHITRCSQANDPSNLRNDDFEGAVRYPFNQYSDTFHDLLEGILPDCLYSICQKLTFYDNKWALKNHLSLVNWLEVEKQLRIINKLDKKSQSMSTVIKDGYFQKKISKDNISRKETFALSGSEQLALARAFWKLWSSVEGMNYFVNCDSQVFLNAKKLLGKVLNLCQIVTMKKELSDDDISNLELEINRFRDIYFDFMPPASNCSLKLHSIMHYPLYARMYRSLWVVSCIRFESSNRRIKNLHQISLNKINPSFTIMGKVGLNLLVEKSLTD